MADANVSGTVVVIPTRNRADLAMVAIRSVLDQPVDDLHLIVSDNSTRQEHRTALAAFCGELSDPRLIYIAPPKSLSMSRHWDWAMGQALERYDAGHFIYLTDRSLFKPGELLKITNLARQHPEQVISYDCVVIFDHWQPIIVERQPHTGQLVEVSTSRLLYLSSRSIFPRCLPRMMNCCIPRSIIKKIQARFGNVFASTAPDYNFCYRCLELVDSVLYYDQAAYVSYGILRGNVSSGVGLTSDALKDFIMTSDPVGNRRCYAAPIPMFENFVNYVVHEYCLVQRESNSQRFPRMRFAQYLFRNIEAKLTTIGYRLPLPLLRVLVSLRTRVRKLLSLQWPTIAKYDTSPGFESVGDAIDYASSIPPSANVSVPHLNQLRGNARS